MAITIDYSQTTYDGFVIQIPKADTTLVTLTPYEVRQLSVDDLRLALGDLQDDEVGMAYPRMFDNTAPKTLAGVTQARVLEILVPYWLLFEDGLYSVNIYGGNSNVAERTIKNSVSVNTANSAGLQDPQQLVDILAEALRARKHLTNKLVTDPSTGVATLFGDDGVTPEETSQLYEDAAGAQTYRGQGAERREGFA